MLHNQNHYVSIFNERARHINIPSHELEKLDSLDKIFCEQGLGIDPAAGLSSKLAHVIHQHVASRLAQGLNIGVITAHIKTRSNLIDCALTRLKINASTENLLKIDGYITNVAVDWREEGNLMPALDAIEEKYKLSI